MRVLVALGGNALLARGEPMTAKNQRENVRKACRQLAPLAMEHELIITHGNGPQVGLLALQALAYADHEEPYPLDVLGAQTEGMIGYLIEQELGNLLPFDKPIATILTMTEVSLADPAFANPTKFVGPAYDQQTAQMMAKKYDWTIKPDGQWWRRVVASPRPLRIFETKPIIWLLEKGAVVVCTGGGGIPTAYQPQTRQLKGVQAVIDKDLASMVVARNLKVDLFVMVTDAHGVCIDFGTPNEQVISQITCAELGSMSFPAGSMGPKVAAAIEFVCQSGNPAVIGALVDLAEILAGQAGTWVKS